MTRVLLRLYPARWRERYGEEFAALLEERALGPFDVLDVLIAAVDAHLNLRGGASAAAHHKGFFMTLRIGGLAAVLGGLAWFGGLYIASNDESEGVSFGGLIFVAGTVLLLLALAGLSAFQSREHPVLVWAAFLLPAAGALVSVAGSVLMALSDEGPVVAGMSAWEVWLLGMVLFVAGSGLFAVASWRTRSASRVGSALLAAAAISVVPNVIGAAGLIAWEPVVSISMLVLLFGFAGGWVATGLAAIRQPAGIVTGPSAT